VATLGLQYYLSTAKPGVYIDEETIYNYFKIKETKFHIAVETKYTELIALF
jgi:hypothetical protein